MSDIQARIQAAREEAKKLKDDIKQERSKLNDKSREFCSLFVIVVVVPSLL